MVLLWNSKRDRGMAVCNCDYCFNSSGYYFITVVYVTSVETPFLFIQPNSGIRARIWAAVNPLHNWIQKSSAAFKWHGSQSRGPGLGIKSSARPFLPDVGVGNADCKRWVQKLHAEANGMESRVPSSREHEDRGGNANKYMFFFILSPVQKDRLQFSH